MERIPARYEGSLESTFIHEHPLNIEIGQYYYVRIDNYQDFTGINDYECIAQVVLILREEIDINIEWKRYIVNGNEQDWIEIIHENMSVNISDMNVLQGRPPVRFYRVPQS